MSCYDPFDYDFQEKCDFYDLETGCTKSEINEEDEGLGEDPAWPATKAAIEQHMALPQESRGGLVDFLPYRRARGLDRKDVGTETGELWRMAG